MEVGPLDLPLVLLALYAAVAAQAALGPHLAIAGVAPDLPLAVLLAYALRTGSVWRSAAAGLALGLALDLLHGTRVGLFMLAASLPAVLCAAARSRMVGRSLLLTWLLACLAAALYGAVVVAGWESLQRGVSVSGAVRHAALAAAYDGTLAAWAWRLLGGRRGRTERIAASDRRAQA